MCDLKQYALRTYGNENAELSDYDKKFVKSLQKFRKTNEAEISKRKCIVFLKDRPITSLFQKPIVRNSNSKKETKEDKEIMYCTATKMNGEKCTSKAKPGCNVCGRHMKKK